MSYLKLWNIEHDFLFIFSKVTCSNFLNKIFPPSNHDLSISQTKARKNIDLIFFYTIFQSRNIRNFV